MFRLKDIVQHPALLVAAVLLGGWMGSLFPSAAQFWTGVGELYFALIRMAALPLVVVAVFFGLQRMTQLPGSLARLPWLLLLSALAMGFSAGVGVLVASLSAAGSGLSAADAGALGELSLVTESPWVMGLHSEAEAPAEQWRLGTLVPDNLFGVLAYGSLASVLVGVLAFGLAVAAQETEQAQSFTRILEGLYRSLEAMVERINSLLPAAAFVLAAAATASAGLTTIFLLGGFLGAFALAALVVLAVSTALLCWRLQSSPWAVLGALREPITLCLFSPVAVAAVPSFIHAMSVRLGFSRGLVEFFAPVAPVFLRAGEALFFAVLAIFVANLYGRVLSPGDVLLICLLSWAAALWSVGVVGVKSVTLGGFVLAFLGLPLEAVLPSFLLVEVLCEGPRNLLSFLVGCGLIALVSRGLSIQASDDLPAPASELRLGLRLSRRMAWLSLALLGLALLTVFAAGVGVGLRGSQLGGAPLVLAAF